VIIARVFGPQGNGQYAVALLLPIFLMTFLNLGVAPANVYHLGAGKVTILTALKVSVKLWFILAVFGIGVGFVIVYFGAKIFFPGVEVQLLWLSLLVFPLSLLQGFLVSIFQGLQRFSEYNFVLLVQPVVTLVLIAGGISAGIRQIDYVIVVYIAGIVIAILLSAYYFVTSKAKNTGLQDDVGYTSSAVNYGLKSNLSNILAYVNYKADIFLVNYLLGTSSAGIYLVAVQLVERLWLLSGSFSTILLPRLSQLHTEENKRKLITPIICRWVFAITLIGSVFLGILSFPLIRLLFGEAYMDAIVPLLLLLPGILAGSGAKILANDIASRGRPELNMYTAWAVLVINIGGNIILIPPYGLAGAATATSVAYTLNLILKLLIYSRFSGNKSIDSLIIKFDDIRAMRMQFKSRS
jgi:O-antigen/teichoic acid export membrane protein